LRLASATCLALAALCVTAFLQLYAPDAAASEPAPNRNGHLIGDVPALLIVAVVFWYLAPAPKGGTG
jgi:hypothetical protein